jgi:hypothetical protein
MVSSLSGYAVPIVADAAAKDTGMAANFGFAALADSW